MFGRKERPLDKRMDDYLYDSDMILKYVGEAAFARKFRKASLPKIKWLRRIAPGTGIYKCHPTVDYGEELVHAEPLYYRHPHAIIDTVKDLEFTVVNITNGEFIKTFPLEIQDAIDFIKLL